MKITVAKPDYADRIQRENAQADTWFTDDVSESVPYPTLQEGGDFSDTYYRIRMPDGQILRLPCTGTGSKKCLFMPAKKLEQRDGLNHEINAKTSSLYKVNSMWQRIFEAQALRAPPDPDLFIMPVLPPVGVRSATFNCLHVKLLMRGCAKTFLQHDMCAGVSEGAGES